MLFGNQVLDRSRSGDIRIRLREADLLTPKFAAEALNVGFSENFKAWLSKTGKQLQTSEIVQ